MGRRYIIYERKLQLDFTENQSNSIFIYGFALCHTKKKKIERREKEERKYRFAEQKEIRDKPEKLI